MHCSDEPMKMLRWLVAGVQPVDVTAPSSTIATGEQGVDYRLYPMDTIVERLALGARDVDMVRRLP